MKKLPFFIGLASLAILIFAFYMSQLDRRGSSDLMQRGNSDRPHRSSHSGGEFDHLDPRETKRPRAPQDPESDINKLKHELNLAKVELEQLRRPLREDIYSSTIHAEINPGETLVCGGYKKDDGNFEITLLTPKSIILSDGSEGIEILPTTLTVGAEFVNETELNSIATNAANTIQHGELWSEDEVRSKFVSAGEYQGTEMMILPKIVSRPSEPFTISIESQDGSQYTISGKAEKSADGKFSVQSRVERIPPPTQVPPANH